MSDMNTPPRKLLNIAKKIIANKPEIPAIIWIVHLRSIFLSSSCRLSKWDSRGKVSERRWIITKRVETSPMPKAQSIPSCQMIIPEKTDTTVKTSPLIVPIFPFALSRSHSGMRRVTRVERAIIRILPATTPSMVTRVSIQSHGFHISVQSDSLNSISIVNARK